MMKKADSKKSTKPLPSWIVVTAKDPKLKAAIEKQIAEKLTETKPNQNNK